MKSFHPLQTVEDFSSLIKILEENQPNLIAIDGDNGVGKTKLARKLIKSLNEYTHIELDNFIRIRNIGYYNISLKKLQKELSLTENRKKILEGIMILKYLKRLKINLRECFLIYIEDRWLDEIWEWENEDGRYYKENIKEIIKEREKNMTIINNAIDKNKKHHQLKDLDKKLLIYKSKFRPWRKADVIFKR